MAHTAQRTAAGSGSPAAPALDRLLGTVPALTERLAAGAAAREAEREAERELPYARAQSVRESGLGALRVPPGHGGPGSDLRTLFRVLIDIAAADSNLAQALRPHFGYVERLISRASEEERRRWFAEVVSGALFGNATGETDTKHPGEIRTLLSRSADGGGYRLNGTKFYSTGSLFADYVVVAAVDEQERRVRVLLPRGREGMRLLDDWDGMGQRTTASGTTLLDDVPVRADEVTREPTQQERRTHIGAFHQLYLAAVQVGIARDALRDAVAYARHTARAVRHSGVGHAVDDPLVQHAVGEISALAFGAEATVLRAAESIDQAIATVAEDEVAGTEEQLGSASIDVARAQVIASQAALRAAERLYDVGGASATRRRHNFDRHWRNARTLASHNPVPHKARVVGDHLLNGAGPPSTGFF
ncbi:acyl-CoA dehydrogenase [Streptomyces sp. HNM0575]|uniref:acyl-CoA dehydrogenase family protein n=1 Tax=Streptomyces sp. HNM0575 TaxID=2716338 RepID=UPI00145DB91D|nr:acyl-CoA dehydrogenase family protein [Streptomyces sp. HNM0575]NLU76240.1 acyl-CoA dehydrogenase [Streptomyces sp. HNM0575]